MGVCIVMADAALAASADSDSQYLPASPYESRRTAMKKPVQVKSNSPAPTIPAQLSAQPSVTPSTGAYVSPARIQPIATPKIVKVEAPSEQSSFNPSYTQPADELQRNLQSLPIPLSSPDIATTAVKSSAPLYPALVHSGQPPIEPPQQSTAPSQPPESSGMTPADAVSAPPATPHSAPHALPPDAPKPTALLPIPVPAHPSDMPDFVPYATLETQKDLSAPVDRGPMSAHPQMQRDRTVSAPDTQPMPSGMHDMPTQPAPLSLPAAAGKPEQSSAAPIAAKMPAAKPEPPATDTHHLTPAANMPPKFPKGDPNLLDFNEPPRNLAKKSILDPETKRIVSHIPGGVDSPRKQSDARTDLSRFDPEIEGILNGDHAEEDETVEHDSMGVSIQVRTPSINVDVELENAYAALMQGETQIAIEIYKDILRAIPTNQDALFGLATTYHQLGEQELARPFYGKLLSINPNHRDGLNNFIVLMAEESPQEAIEQLHALERRNPDFSPIPAQLGILYNKIGNKARAKQYMIRSIRLAPENMAYKYNLAVLFDEHGMYDDAGVLYRQLLAAERSGIAIPADADEINDRLIYINNMENRE